MRAPVGGLFRHVCDLARGQAPKQVIAALGHTVHELDNGAKPVPSIYLTPVFVTKDNMVDTVIRDDWHPLAKVYRNVPKADWPKP